MALHFQNENALARHHNQEVNFARILTEMAWKVETMEYDPVSASLRVSKCCEDLFFAWWCVLMDEVGNQARHS
jgi:hypothetical protein